MKKQILKILSGIICIFGILTIIPVKAVKFKIKAQKDIEGYVIIMADKRSGITKSLSTCVMTKDPSVLFWNKKLISVTKKSILKILKNRIIAGSSFDRNYYNELAENLRQDHVLYEYLKKRFNKER